MNEELMTVDMAMQNTDSSQATVEQAVATYGDMVYGAALRQTGDADVAADITQGVFVVLARRAASGKLPKEAYMAGWLLTAVHYGVKEARRAVARRSYHERHAAGLRKEGAAGEGALPEEVLAAVDGALLQLRARDRELVVRRYLGGEAVGAIAAAIHVRENTVGRRIARALDKVRRILARRGVVVPAGTLGVLLSAEGARSAPAGVITTAKGAASAKSVLAELILRRMLMVKLKLIAAAVVAAVAAGAGGGLIADIASQGPRQEMVPTLAVKAPAAPATVSTDGFTVTTETGMTLRLEALVNGAILQHGNEWWSPDGSAREAVVLQASVGRGGGVPVLDAGTGRSGPRVMVITNGGVMGLGAGNGVATPDTWSVWFNIAQESEDGRAFAYRISSNPPGNIAKGNTRSGYQAAVLHFRNNPETVDFRFELTVDGWTNYVVHPGTSTPSDNDAVTMQSFGADGRPGVGTTQILDYLDGDFQKELMFRDEGHESIAPSLLRGVGEMGPRYRVPDHPTEQYLAVRPYTLVVDFKNVSMRSGKLTKVETVVKELPDLPVREDLKKLLKSVESGGDIRAGLAAEAEASTAGVLGEFRKLGEGGGAVGLRVKEVWVDGPSACAVVDQKRPARGAEDKHLGLMLVRTERKWQASKAELLRGDEAVSGYVRGFCNVGNQPANEVKEAGGGVP
jgi:RNA polymerase sigma factor (sigma-70 family)